MGLASTFTNSIVREIGRNYGKSISNNLLGDSHSTPVRMVRGGQTDITRKRGRIYENKLDEYLQKFSIKGATATFNQGQNIFNAYFELAEEALPDLIICDVMMPRLDGFEVLGTIRKNPALAMTPFIFLTARIENQDTEKGLNLGADDYVPKPFDPIVLIRLIRSRIEKYQTINASLNQVRENLIGKVPHEFRTPLNGILGFASMMKENALILSPAEVRDFSGLIVESGERMLQTVVNYVKYLELQVYIGKRELPAKYLEAEVDVDTIEIGALLERFYVQFPMRT